MSTTVTLGGERLGSGKKQKIELHGYERSTHDLGYLWRSTMGAGTLVPFLSEVAMPGDTFDINLGCSVLTHPTIGPLFGSFKVQLDIFQCPVRLYQGQLHNNKLGIGMNMSNVKLPYLKLKAMPYDADVDNGDLDNSQINPSSILSYLGIRGVGLNVTGETNLYRNFNAIPYLGYVDIYKNYYSNKQEEIGAVIHGGASATPVETVNQIDFIDENDGGHTVVKEGSGVSLVVPGIGWGLAINFTGGTPLPETIIFTRSDGSTITAAEIATDFRIISAGLLRGEVRPSMVGGAAIIYWNYTASSEAFEPVVVTFPLNDIDKMREQILAAAVSSTAFNVLDTARSNNLYPYRYLQSGLGEGTTYRNTQEGLLIKTYQSDLFNNWLSTEWIDGTGGINEITAIDTSGGSFNIDTLNLSKKVYDMLNRIAVSGGTYDDWLDAVYDHPRYMRAESPMYMGGLSKELVFQEVVSNSEAVNSLGTQPLGTLAGRGVMSSKHKGGEIVIKVDEPSYIIGIVSLTPRLDYSQGNKWDTHLETMDDFHKPALDQIGFQELITEQMAWWSTTREEPGTWVTRSAGKQPAWINYMTNVNQVRGNFAVPVGGNGFGEMFMVLNRKYEFEVGTGIKDLTTYVDPIKFNDIFADASLDAQNFWTQISVDMIARRKMSAKVMPNL